MPRLISPGQSTFPASTSFGGTPLADRRQSTGTAGSGAGLDYYWSNAAGMGPSSSASSSSSIAISPSPSLGPGEGQEGAKRGLYRRSEASLRDLIAQEQRRGEGHAALESPSWSGESDYSSSHSLPLGTSATSSNSGHQHANKPVEVWNAERAREYDFTRQSMTSTTTARPGGARAEDTEYQPANERTPVVAQTGDRPDIRAPGFTYGSDSLHATPVVSQTNFGRSQPSPSSYTPGSGRLDSTGARRGGTPPASGSPATSPGSGPSSEPQSAPPWQGDFGLGMGKVGAEGEVEETTIKGRGRDKRSTLPAVPLDLPGEYLSPDKRQKGTASPQPPPRSALRTQLAGITSPPPNLSFHYSPSAHRSNDSPDISPPTRSIGRLSLSSSPTSSPPLSRDASKDLPSSHVLSGLRSRESVDSTSSLQSPTSINDLTDLLGGAIDEIGLMDSRETPPPMIAADSREKPRPGALNLSTSSLPPPEEKVASGPITPRSLPSRGESLASASSSSSSALGTGLVPAPTPAATPFPVAQEDAYPPSIASTDRHARQTSVSTLHAPPTAVGFSAKPWPAAMLFGHIKNMKHSGDRAKYYAKGINELSIADSGLRDWCIISASSAHRVPPARMPLNRLQSNISARTDFAPSIHIQPALPSSLAHSYANGTGQSNHPRSVSSSSEFPMREDSYSAREISQRVIDPGDEPTSLPPNLPYPQLQQVRNGGIRSSPSVASMASMASTNTSTGTIHGGGGGGGSGSSKRGFFSALRGKKEGPGLGPPTGAVPSSSGSGAGKKDVRGLPISNPERTSLSGPSPMGPRGPRMGGMGEANSADAGPYRNSLDTQSPYRGSLDDGSASRLTPPPTAGLGRASFDTGSGQSQRTNVSSRLQQAATGPAAGAGGGGLGGMIMPKEEDVRAMQEVLPNVDRGVLRAYLAKYGDQMGAITAYFEDEKRGGIRA